MLRAGLVALALLATLAALTTPASAQRRRYRYHHHQEHHPHSSGRPLTPEEIAAHEAEMATLQARCDEVGRERCLEEDRARREAHLGAVTRENVLMVVGALGLVIAWLAWGRSSARRRRFLPPSQIEQALTEEPPWDLAAIEIALDARQVPLVRGNLEGIRGAHPDLAAALPEIARALASLSWTHVSLRQWPKSDRVGAQERHRTVRAEILGRESMHVPPDPGRGYRGEPGSEKQDASRALVSLVVLARAEIPEQLGTPADAARAALERVARLSTADVVAVDLVWYPSGQGESTSERELLARAPRLVGIG